MPPSGYSGAHHLLLHLSNLVFKCDYFKLLLLHLPFHLHPHFIHLGLTLIELELHFSIDSLQVPHLLLQLLYLGFSLPQLQSELLLLADVNTQHLLVFTHKLVPMELDLILEFDGPEFVVTRLNHQGELLLIVDDSDVVVVTVGERWLKAVHVVGDVRGLGRVGEGVAVKWFIVKGLIWGGILWEWYGVRVLLGAFF